MALLKVNATATGLKLHETSMEADYAIADLVSCSGPAVIMVHGFKYAPGSARHCPHKKLFNDTPTGWPRGLGFETAGDQNGIGVAMGWYARGPLRKVHRRAGILGYDLAQIVTQLRNSKPDRPVHIVAHSMGTEVALSALSYLQHNAVNRIILLAGASHQSRATEALMTPAGRTVEILNVVSRENDLFDAMFEHLVPSTQDHGKAIGEGIRADNVVNLQIDCPSSLKALHELSYPVMAPDRTVCHWSSYRRQGLLQFYNQFLRNPDQLSLQMLANALPKEAEPRWSRLKTPQGFAKVAQSLYLQHITGPVGSVTRRFKAAWVRRSDSEHAY